MAYETILLEKDADDAFAILTLNRPDKLNAIDKTVIHEIVHAVKACSVDPAINALVIRGAGRSFSAGYDLQGGDFDVDIEFWRDDMTENAEAWLEIYRAPIPVLASVHGYALAGVLNEGNLRDAGAPKDHHQEQRFGLPEHPPQQHVSPLRARR